jgi:repressor LexA
MGALNVSKQASLLTSRQRRVLEYVRAQVREKGVPPSVREIADRFGFRSTRSAFDHLRALQRKGRIRRRKGHRGLVVVGSEKGTGEPETLRVRDGRGNEAGQSDVQYSVSGCRIRMEGVSRGLPIVGTIAAGTPLLAEQNLEGYADFDHFFGRREDLFLLRVRGDSMIDAGIWDGDHVVVRRQARVDNGEVAVVLLEDEATVKRFFLERGRVRLQPANDSMEPIWIERGGGCQVLGKVIGVVRKT